MIFIEDILPQVVDIARTAGAKIMTYYKMGGAVEQKGDKSPVTEADREANRMIVEALASIAPDILIVSEEGDKPDVSRVKHFWLVDPLDGTRSFIRGGGYFTVNIALVEDKKNPIMGVIYDPVSGAMYYGSEKGAFREHNGITEQLYVNKKQNPVTALVSHSHLNEATECYLAAHRVKERIPCPSSIKFCMLAEGRADIYPRFGPTMEWDVAAGHAILQAAGGSVKTPEGLPFLYGKKDFLNGNFVAFS